MRDDYREINPRDWRVRLAALAALALILALCWTLALAVREHVAALRAVAETDPATAARRAGSFLRATFALLAAANTVVAAYLLRLGVRVAATGKLPPPGAWIVKGRRVYEGRFVRRVGRIFVLLAILIAGASTVMVWLGWRLTAG